MSAPRIFDQQHYGLLNRARGELVTRLVSELKAPLDLRTSVDIGCGLGHFSALLHSLGLAVTGVDGRLENTEEAARRVPEVHFHTINAEDAALRSLGTFDLVFCFGLLYHLENPLLSIRHLRAMTKTILLVESVVFPGSEPVMGLIDESPYEDQGLNHIAFYPTEACLVKMMYRVGFQCVYGFAKQPDHSEYRESSGSRRTRTVLAASFTPVNSEQLIVAREPNSPIRPWDPKSDIDSASDVNKWRRFAAKSFPEKVKSIKGIIKAR